MNKKRQIIGLVLMIYLLSIFLINSPRIYDNYLESPGIYKATYNFRDCKTGESTPERWSLCNLGDGNTFKIIEEFNDHNKVVKFKRGENNETFISFEYLVDKSPPTCGFIEWYWASADIKNTTLYFQVRGSSGDDQKRQVILYFDKEGIGVGVNKYSSVEDNHWYHCRYVFDANDGDHGKYKLYVNGELVIENNNFLNTNVPDLNRMIFYGSQGYDCYLDAIGFSWDPNYEIGDNLYLERSIHPITNLWNFIFSGIIILTIIFILNPKVNLPIVASFLVKNKIIKKKNYIQILNFFFLIF